MKLKKMWLTPTVEVAFTSEEIDYLIERAKKHYDSTCQAAGMSYEDGARENGFIKQLKLFPNLTPIWTSRQIDLTLKILEPFVRSHYEDEMRGRLFDELRAIHTSMQIKYRKLNGV